MYRYTVLSLFHVVILSKHHHHHHRPSSFRPQSNPPQSLKEHNDDNRRYKNGNDNYDSNNEVSNINAYENNDGNDNARNRSIGDETEFEALTSEVVSTRNGNKNHSSDDSNMGDKYGDRDHDGTYTDEHNVDIDIMDRSFAADILLSYATQTYDTNNRCVIPYLLYL
jgi:hypothetical protein